ncbi:MAG TPA: extracellular solute-binding protein [Eubacteriales bacterium]|nr:extracellular solute-binding protein [Eubacteriales bacterium]
MKSKMKKVVALLLVAALLLGTITMLSGCSKKADDNTLTIWINGKDSYIGPSEQKLSQEDWYISQAIQRFEDANPGVTVELVVSADGETAHQTFKADAMAGTAPDLANLWTGQNIFSMEDVILDISDLIPEEDLENISGWDSVTSPATGAILGYPTSDNQICFFIYNKQIISECGLDFDNNPPRTIDEFNAACQTILDNGYTPIASDESFPWFGCYIVNYWWVQQSGYDRILSDCDGTTTFADDAGLISALEYYRSTIENGYLNADAVTSADSWNKFCQGTVAMMPQVSSVVSDAEDALGAENVGVMLPPDFDGAQITDQTIGGPGQCLVVSKDCKNPELAVKFLSFLNSRDEVLRFLEVQSKVPTRTDITAEDLGLAADSATAKLFDWSDQIVYWVDNSLYSTVVGDYYNLLPLVLAGKMTPVEFAEDLDGCVTAG